MYHASVTTVTTNSQGDLCTVYCYLHVKIPQTETGHQCSPRNGPLLEKSYFTLMYVFTNLTCCDEPTPGCADIRPWHRNRQDSISVTMLRVRSKFFHKIRQNSKHDSHLESLTNRSSFPVALSLCFLSMVGGSSDLCRLCQFLWDSAEQTALSRNRRPDNGRRFPLVYMCVC